MAVGVIKSTTAKEAAGVTTKAAQKVPMSIETRDGSYFVSYLVTVVAFLLGYRFFYHFQFRPYFTVLVALFFVLNPFRQIIKKN